MTEIQHKKIFRVMTPLSIRAEPGLSGARQPDQLKPGVQIEVDAASRREIDGYIWWQHSQGWSAERKIDGEGVYLEEVADKRIHADEPTSGPRVFRVLRQLSVRTEPGLNGPRIPDGDLEAEQIIEVKGDSRREADGFIWWRHSTGWSAERREDYTQVFMLPSEDKPTTSLPDIPAPVETTPAEKSPEQAAVRRAFRVTQPLSVRAEPGLSGARGPQVLEAGTVIECDEDSRREVDGYVWLRHELGWSAERSVDFAQVYLEAPAEDSAEETSASAAEPAEKSPQQASARRRAFKVMQALSVRVEPGLNARRLPGTLEVGAVIECDEDSRCEVDEHIWWKHSAGWSAEAKLDGSIVFLRDPDAVAPVNPDGSLNVDGLPGRDELFQRLPVDLHNIAWVQYYGNTGFAFREGQRWNYPAFSQGLHSGLDLASRVDKVPVHAGVAGVFLRNDGFGVAVRSGEYVLIYQHLTSTSSYVRGGPVTPDTIMGIMDPALKDNRHLHLEVRYDRERWIINPLLLMPPPMRDGVTRKFANFASHFYRDQHWTRWQTPLDQPVILRGGPVIGPTAR
jgi:hypothetical protein